MEKMNEIGSVMVAEEGFEPPLPLCIQRLTAHLHIVCTFLLLLIATQALASEPWDTTDKALFGASILTATADIITTRQAIDNGGVEANPLYGDASTGRLVAVKSAFLVVRLLLADQLTGWWRKVFLGSSICLELYASRNNMQVSGEARW